MKLVNYLIVVLFTIIFSCRDKSQPNLKPMDVKNDSTPMKKDTFDFSAYSEYKVLSSNNEYGKRIDIDSLHFKIMRRFFVTDSTKLRYEHYEDFVNDTARYKEYFINGNLKELRRKTVRRGIPIRKWVFYNKNGTLIKTINHSQGGMISIDEAIKIAKDNNVQRPYVFEINPDSTNWYVINWKWKDVTNDSINNNSTEVGKGILINGMNGKVENVEYERTYDH